MTAAGVAELLALTLPLLIELGAVAAADAVAVAAALDAVVLAAAAAVVVAAVAVPAWVA